MGGQGAIEAFGRYPVEVTRTTDIHPHKSLRRISHSEYPRGYPVATVKGTRCALCCVRPSPAVHLMAMKTEIWCPDM